MERYEAIPVYSMMAIKRATGDPIERETERQKEWERDTHARRQRETEREREIISIENGRQDEHLFTSGTLSDRCLAHPMVVKIWSRTTEASDWVW